jgi:hypothetical protein
LRLWDTASPLYFIEALLSMLQVVSYPYISLFYGGPYGLLFLFIFSKAPQHSPVLFPSSWLHIVRSGVPMAAQQHDSMKVLTQSGSDEAWRLAHGRRLSDVQLSQTHVFTLAQWALAQMGLHLLELSDPANFLDRDDCIDFVFAFEHMLSWLRILRQAVRTLATEELPQGKLASFDVADLLDGLRHRQEISE